MAKKDRKPVLPRGFLLTKEIGLVYVYEHFHDVNRRVRSTWISRDEPRETRDKLIGVFPYNKNRWRNRTYDIRVDSHLRTKRGRRLHLGVPEGYFIEFGAYNRLTGKYDRVTVRKRYDDYRNPYLERLKKRLEKVKELIAAGVDRQAAIKVATKMCKCSH